MKTYAGIGSRKTPIEIQEIMTRAARALELRGYGLRSGGAEGADTAFEEGVQDAAHKEVFLPWRGFRGHASHYAAPSPEAIVIGARFHPIFQDWSPQRFSQCSSRERTLLALMGRNVHQVLGWKLQDPVAFVLCWTPDGADGAQVPTGPESGGTGQAIRIAAAHQIPVFNLAQEAHLKRVQVMIGA